MIGLISAMDIELDAYIELMQDKKEYNYAGLTYYHGMLMGKEIAICNCGVGKVNAAMHTQILIEKFHPDVIIQNGIAGSLSHDVRQFDIVIGNELIYHDMPDNVVEQFGPLERIYHADPGLVELVRSIVKENRVHVGRIATGDQFIASTSEKDRIRDNTGALCVEMEGCAVAHTAYLNGIPFIVMRAISDMADDDAGVDFSEFQVIAANKTVEIILEMIQNI